LWRLENGELPESLNPAVFWVLIGTNDFKDECSAEAIVMGIIRVVEEILLHKPSSTVVINQLFPRSKPYNMDGHVYVLPEGSEDQPILQIYIDEINLALRAYANNRAGVEYYSTDFFWVDPTASRLDKQIDTNLVPDCLHPYATGYELWAQEIVATLDSLLGGDSSNADVADGSLAEPPIEDIAGLDESLGGTSDSTGTEPEISDLFVSGSARGGSFPEILLFWAATFTAAIAGIV